MERAPRRGRGHERGLVGARPRLGRCQAAGDRPLTGGDEVLWTTPQAQCDVVDIVGPGAQLVRDDAANRCDVLPLLGATDGAITAFEHDGRRLRPNLVIGGVDSLAYHSWPGK